MDYYALLRVARNASMKDIKNAYRTIALTLHPDVNGGGQVKTAAFKEATEAYDTLSNETLRRQYDSSMGVNTRVRDPTTSSRNRQQPRAPRQPPRSQGRTTRVYDFNGWNEQHYGEDFDPTRNLDNAAGRSWTGPARESLGIRNETRSEKDYQSAHARRVMNERSAIRSRMDARRQQRHQAAANSQSAKSDQSGCAVQ